MKRYIYLAFVPSMLILPSCAGMYFSDSPTANSLRFSETIPAVKVTQAPDCTISSEIVSLPGKPRYVSFRSGLGKAKSSLEFGPGGIVNKVNAESEGQVADAMQIATGVAGVLGLDGSRGTSGGSCQANARIHPIQTDLDGRITVNTSETIFSFSG